VDGSFVNTLLKYKKEGKKRGLLDRIKRNCQKKSVDGPVLGVLENEIIHTHTKISDGRGSL
jgi:hypothetical protein